MNIAVLKFGGTSVATPQARDLVCDHVAEAIARGLNVVVVVSAMGRAGSPYATDTLLDLIKVEHQKDNLRELDFVFACGELLAAAVVSACLKEKGHRSFCLTGQQAGMITDDNFGNASIKRVEPERILDLLREGYVVVVTGGQGITEQGDITSLGRGSSDITCTALGVALDAVRMDVFTDVPGVMTADPKVIPNAQLIERISYTQCKNMAKAGAKVIHPLAIAIAEQKPHIPLRVRSTFSKEPGTLVTANNF